VSEIDTAREADQIEGVSLPEQTKNLIGHQQVFSQIVEQAKNNKLPSAMLIHGQKGIGKATFAFALAKEIFSLSNPQAKNEINEQVAQGSYPNLFILRKAAKKPKGFYSEIRIDEVRELHSKMHKTRGRAGHRICIIDAIDDCSIKASNALLKILEEPPADSLFILISHRHGSLLPTIHSRSHSYGLRILNDDEVKNAALQNINDESDLDKCVRLAQGRPRRAIEAAMLKELALLNDLQDWLELGEQQPTITQLILAEDIVKSNEAAQAFAKEIIVTHIANLAKITTQNTPVSRVYLASITKLWDKAKSLFADMEKYNLDKKQTLISIFDEIVKHKQLTQ